MLGSLLRASALVWDCIYSTSVLLLYCQGLFIVRIIKCSCGVWHTMSLHDKHLSCNCTGNPLSGLSIGGIGRATTVPSSVPCLGPCVTWNTVPSGPFIPGRCSQPPSQIFSHHFRSTRFPLSNGLLGSLANLAYAPSATAFDDAAAPRLPRKSLHYRTWYQIRDTRTAATAPPHGLCDSCPTMLHMSIRIEVSARAQARCLQYNRVWRVEQETV